MSNRNVVPMNKNINALQSEVLSSLDNMVRIIGETQLEVINRGYTQAIENITTVFDTEQERLKQKIFNLMQKAEIDV